MDKFIITFYFMMILNYILGALFVFLRKEIMDAIKLRLLTMFGHDYCIVRIHKNDKRIKKYVVKPDKDTGEFLINDGIYMVVPSRAYFEGSIPSYTYNEDNYMPIDPNDIKSPPEMDPSLVNKVVMRAKATGKLAEWMKQNRTILMVVLVTGAMVIISVYFGYKNNLFLQTTGELTMEQVIMKYCSGSVITG